jgi:hypothetical protein
MKRNVVTSALEAELIAPKRKAIHYIVKKTVSQRNTTISIVKERR